MNLQERLKVKYYKVTINGESCSLDAQSLGSALVKTSVLCLEDTDTVTIKLELCQKD